MKTDVGMITGTMDLVAAGAILFGLLFQVSGDFFMGFGVLMLLKFVFNLYRFKPLNPVPWIDLLAGMMLLLIYFDIKSSLFAIIGLLELIKGAFAFLSTSGLG